MLAGGAKAAQRVSDMIIPKYDVCSNPPTIFSVVSVLPKTGFKSTNMVYYRISTFCPFRTTP